MSLERSPPQHDGRPAGNGKGAAPLPVLRPRLPSADALMPWLRRIDESRQYSNFGPLAGEFEARMAVHFGVPRGAVLALASGTAGLTAALLALNLPRGSLCVVPDWTFAGTLNAVVAAGLTPFLVDVDADSWALTPALAEAALARAPAAQSVGVVMPVSPFGAPLPLDQWESFRRITGVPVVVDAAAAFDGTGASAVPQVMSLHATKSFGIGEGGLLVCRDEAFVAAVRAAANFGFAGSRIPAVAAVNAKLSEYHAAVGLAALEEWPQRRACLYATGQALRAAVCGLQGVDLPPGQAKTWVSATFLVRLPASLPAVLAEAGMAALGVETRRWWGVLMGDQAPFAGCPRLPTPTARALCDTALGLPSGEDLSPEDVARVGAALDAVLNSHRQKVVAPA